MAAAWTTLEKTYAMIKPDAVGAVNAELILRAAEDAGFIVVKAARTTLSRERAGEFYAEHRGKPFFPNLVSFMSSGPIVAVCLAKTNAIADWRALMGPTNTLVAREEKPKSLRALYGTDGTKNATHGSDSLVSASRELKFFFPNLTLDQVPEGAAGVVADVWGLLAAHAAQMAAVRAKEARPLGGAQAVRGAQQDAAVERLSAGGRAGAAEGVVWTGAGVAEEEESAMLGNEELVSILFADLPRTVPEAALQAQSEPLALAQAGGGKEEVNLGPAGPLPSELRPS